MEKVRREKMQVRERYESHEPLCFSIHLWLRKVEK